MNQMKLKNMPINTERLCLNYINDNDKGIATECDDGELKQRIIEECPVLQQRFGAVGMEHFIMFKVQVENVEIK